MLTFLTLRLSKAVISFENRYVTTQAMTKETGLTVKANTMLSLSQEDITAPVSHQPGHSDSAMPASVMRSFYARIRRRISFWW